MKTEKKLEGKRKKREWRKKENEERKRMKKEREMDRQMSKIIVTDKKDEEEKM